MDHAVSLVQAYLQLNGYFTAAEYPLMELNGEKEFRTLTDIDILAFRFPTTSHHLVIPDPQRPMHVGMAAPDPDLDVPSDRIDMIIGEVKEGRVGINEGAHHPDVLRAVMLRFGCAPYDVERILEGVRDSGFAVMPSGYQARLIAFGTMPPGGDLAPCRIISLKHVLNYLQEYVRKNWSILRHCQFKDPAFGFLMTLEKARRGEAGRRGTRGVEIVRAERDGAPSDRSQTRAPRSFSGPRPQLPRPHRGPKRPRRANPARTRVD